MNITIFFTSDCLTLFVKITKIKKELFTGLPSEIQHVTTLMTPTLIAQGDTKGFKPQIGLQCSYRPGTLLLEIFGHPAILIISTLLTLLLLSMVVFVIYPNVDSTNGFSVLQLQLSFDTDHAQRIVAAWGDQGRYYYVKWLFTGYLLAIAYGVMLTALLIRARLLRNLSTNQQQSSSIKSFPWILLLPTLAATLDVIENSLHLCFLSNQLTSEISFQALCLTSVAKWISLTAVLVYLVSSSSARTSPD